MSWSVRKPGEKRDLASQERVEGHKRGGADKAAKQGQDWEDRDRDDEK